MFNVNDELLGAYNVLLNFHAQDSISSLERKLIGVFTHLVVIFSGFSKSVFTLLVEH
jgi:hypothetical protein